MPAVRRLWDNRRNTRFCEKVFRPNGARPATRSGHAAPPFPLKAGTEPRRGDRPAKSALRSGGRCSSIRTICGKSDGQFGYACRFDAAPDVPTLAAHIAVPVRNRSTNGSCRRPAAQASRRTGGDRCRPWCLSGVRGHRATSRLILTRGPAATMTGACLARACTTLGGVRRRLGSVQARISNQRRQHAPVMGPRSSLNDARKAQRLRLLTAIAGPASFPWLRLRRWRRESGENRERPSLSRCPLPPILKKYG